ncbi:MAG: hypothetical protein QOF02_3704 [Blastocatellia bacterium]|nr:hypothetical protein [Blastocatellia bacterium]
MKLTACALLLLCVLSLSFAPANGSRVAPPPASQSDDINKANWQQRPKIKAVRAVVQTVKNGMSRNSFKVRTREFEYCEPYADGRRAIATDKSGRVRYYEKQAGSDDSALKWEHYYDEQGRLRFVFITGGAANGAELEHRIYFDEGGKRIWEEQKYTKGEGYTFPTVWPDEQLHFNNVLAAFDAKSPCAEKRSPKSKVQSPKSKKRS